MRLSNGVIHHVVLWTVAAAVAMACTVAGAQPRYGLPPEVAAVFNRWVLASCIGDEERALIDDLRRYREPLAVAFQKAIVDGPSPRELREARAAASERYDARAKFPLDEFRVEGVSKEELERFRRVPRQQYIDDQVRRFALGYRSNAVAGLGIVAGPASRERLARIANNRNDPLAPAAREALKAADRQ